MIKSTPEDVEQAAREFVEAVRAHLGDDLRMAALYGSAARGGYNASSDVNVLLVVRRLDLAALKTLSQPVQRARDGHRLAPFLLLERELPALAEHFPLKVHEIRLHHRVLYGDDLLSSFPEDRTSFKARLDLELLQIGLRLRRAMLFGSPSPPLLARPLRAFVPQLLTILNLMAELAPEAGNSDTARLRQALHERRGTLEKMPYHELEECYALILSKLEGLREAVARL